MIYKYRIHSWLGTVDAEDVRDALSKALAEYLSRKDPPYLSNNWASVKIQVELCIKIGE